MIQIEERFFEYMFFNLFVITEDICELEERIDPTLAYDLLNTNNENLLEVIKYKKKIYEKLIEISEDYR